MAAVLAFVLIAVLNINTAYVILLFIILGIAALSNERQSDQLEKRAKRPKRR